MLLETQGYKNLGYINIWTMQGQTEPEIYKKCKEKGHKLEYTSNHLRCWSMAWCDKCKYYYQIDSSD